MKLRSLYQDIFSRLNLNGVDNSVYYGDIIKAINDAIRTQRIEFVQKGRASDLAVTESLSNFNESSFYPFLKEDTLSKNILQDISVGNAVLIATSFETTNTLEDNNQSFSIGDVAVKQGTTDYYEAVDSITSQNTFDLTFEVNNVREYDPDNNLSYVTGDVIFKDPFFYKVTSSFVANGLDYSDNYEKLFWRRVGGNYLEPDYYPLDRLAELTLYESKYVFGVDGNKIYSSPNTKQITITYVPKWETVDDLDVELNLPDYMYQSVKQQALRSVAMKLNIEMPQQQQEDG